MMRVVQFVRDEIPCDMLTTRTFQHTIEMVIAKGVVSVETTNINIRMEKALKEQAENLFSELGMNMTTAFNIFVRQSVRQGKIPFEIALIRPIEEAEMKRQARTAFGDVVREMQEQSVENGTDNIPLDDINGIIAECRQEARAEQ